MPHSEFRASRESPMKPLVVAFLTMFLLLLTACNQPAPPASDALPPVPPGPPSSNARRGEPPKEQQEQDAVMQVVTRTPEGEGSATEAGGEIAAGVGESAKRLPELG